jgi:hypothetical protein
LFRIVSITALIAGLVGCAAVPTFGHVSTTPVALPNGELAYVYEGRANFAHQTEVADKMMAEHCAKVNGGAPVVVNAQRTVIGAANFANATTNANATATGPYQARSYSGTANTYGTSSAMVNRQQQLMFRCVKQ